MKARARKLILTIPLLSVVVASAITIWHFWPKSPADTSRRVFNGSSDQLQRTEVLPTLDSPINENQSAIWCLSVQLAWNRLKEDMAKEPVKLRNGQQIADRLNRAPQSEADVVPGDFIAMSGKVKDGIGKKIEAALAAKFPGNSMPAIPQVPDSVVTFGYIRADVRYAYRFFSNSPEWLSFKGSDGRTIPVSAFGIPVSRKTDPNADGCRKQVRVLFREGGQFAVDLSQESKPYQVVLAKMPRKSTLAETLNELNKKLAAGASFDLPKSATLLVPDVNWRIEHHFRELEGEDKEFLNAALTDCYLAKVFQFVDFKMDRFGSRVESGAYTGSFKLNGGEHPEDTDPTHYYFDRPFLIMMKKRDAKHPFFVMWVANTELLSTR